MSIISKGVNTVAFSAGQMIDQGINAISNGLTGIVGGVQGAVGSILQTDFVGIDAAQVDSMKSAVNQYVSQIQSHLDEVNAAADSTQAVHGGAADALKEYATAISACCKAYTSQLLQFNDQLTEIQAAYQSQDTTTASTISGNASEAQSQASANTYQGQ